MTSLFRRQLLVTVATMSVVHVAGARDATPDEATRTRADSDGVQRATIVAGNYFFRPRRIVVRVGVPVELAVRVEPGIVPHSLVLDAPQANLSIDADLSEETTTFRFTPGAVGQYEFYCRNKLLLFKSHRERGMHGVLEVIGNG